jgi:hypothetical protein
MPEVDSKTFAGLVAGMNQQAPDGQMAWLQHPS